jgi:hypothetical protein
MLPAIMTRQTDSFVLGAWRWWTVKPVDPRIVTP